VRMRRRMASLIWDFRDLSDFSTIVSRELGVDVPYSSMVADWPTFFRGCELQDVLDIVTIAYRYLEGKMSTGIKEIIAPERWCIEVRRIFAEENIQYRVDEKCGVHFHVDAEFAANQAATIAALLGPRYGNVAAEFEGAMAALSKAPPDGKSAIRGTFSAAEGLFRLMFPKSPRLTAQEAQKLEPLLQTTYANSVASGAAMKVLSAFKDWIDAAHFYRHEAGHEDPVQPPLTLSVQMVSVGAAFIRWLAELDALMRSANHTS